MTTSFTKSVGAAGIALLALAAPALASDMTPAPEGREFSWSVNAALTSDYIFRGVSQTDEEAAVQAGFDASYGILYAGIWASSVDKDFVGGSPTEIDIYAGIKPTWGPATFDLGVLYYYYPGSTQAGPGNPDVVELKAGVSGEILPKLSAAQTFYWSPEAAYDAGEYWVSETTLAYALPKVFVFDPSLSGTVGFVDNLDFDSDYTYWNAGLTLAYGKFSFDFRYWDTDSDGETLYGDLADERFVFTAKVVLP
ncbi:TorF family putative porin [Hyphomicrobium sp.]|uniref:TorF family putative porin n=1 Tax=Hyphomicrobium sp. TaxID=82 RepID=UPI002E3088AC|nr:TorF family putative porin [Hyphomicrobium sp.]HEX2842041.1 TorF family putative porin [Hyphomicrobium sp.]